jgi:hypothetical protein
MVKEERREDIGHSSIKKAIHVLLVREVIQFGNATLSEVKLLMRNGKLREELGCVTDASGKIIWGVRVQEVDSVILMVARKPTVVYSMGKEELIPKVLIKIAMLRKNLP